MMILAVSLLLAAAAPLDTAKIDQLTNLKGAIDAASGVYKVTMPRGELNVVVDGVKLPPAMGIACWAAFHSAGKTTMVMGDLVLTEDQVNPVMSEALDDGLEVTALHNHFLGDSPRVMFMHIGGSGTTDALAGAVGKVFAKITATAGGKGETHAPLAIDATKSTLDPKKIDAALGRSGQLANGVYKVVVARKATVGGHEMGAPMGVNTWAAFAGSDDQAVVDGDFAMHENELQGVLKALRAANIDVVAIHSHMVGEEPRTLFLHYWGVGKSEDLAKGLASALAKTKG